MRMLDPVRGPGSNVNQHTREGSRSRSKAWPTLRTAPTWLARFATAGASPAGWSTFLAQGRNSASAKVPAARTPLKPVAFATGSLRTVPR
jgi:hypothetical protein